MVIRNTFCYEHCNLLTLIKLNIKPNDQLLNKHLNKSDWLCSGNPTLNNYVRSVNKPLQVVAISDGDA